MDVRTLGCGAYREWTVCARLPRRRAAAHPARRHECRGRTRRSSRDDPAARHGRAGEQYILGGPFVTLADVAATLAEVTGLPAPRFRIPYRVAWAYAKLAESWARVTGGETLATVAGVQTMHAQLRVSSHKALRELRWRYRPLRDTLRDEVAWYRAHGIAGRHAVGGTLSSLNRTVSRPADVEAE
jgi:hypothetical protein